MKSFRQGILIAVAVVMIAVSVILILLNQGVKEKTMGSGTESFTGTIEKLIFEAGACEIEIREGEAGQVTLWYQGMQADDISASLENGTLKIKSSYKSGWNLGRLIRIGRKRDEAKICLTIPKDMVFQSAILEFGAAEVEVERVVAEDLTLTIGAGEMNAQYLAGSKSAKLSVGAGSLEAEQVSFTNADLNCGVGEMKLSGEILGDSIVDCGVGEVEIAMTIAEEAYRGKLSCGLGSLKFGKTSVDGSGKREYGTSSAENRMDIKCGLGEVEVWFQ